MYLVVNVVKFAQMAAVEAISARAVALEGACFVLVSVVEAGESKVAVRLTSIEVQFLRWKSYFDYFDYVANIFFLNTNL